MTRADWKHCGKMPDAREELNGSVREGRIESRHSIKSLEEMGSSSHDLEAKLRMHSFTVNCDTFSNEEKVAVVVPVASVEITCSEAMLALSLSTLLVECLIIILGRSALGLMVGNILGGCLFESVLTIWCSSLLEDACNNDALLSCVFFRLIDFIFQHSNLFII